MCRYLFKQNIGPNCADIHNKPYILIMVPEMLAQNDQFTHIWV